MTNTINYFLGDDLGRLIVHLKASRADTGKVEPLSTIKFWYRWSNNDIEIKKATGVKSTDTLGALYNKNNKRNLTRNEGYMPDYSLQDMLSAQKAMDKMTKDSRAIINIHLKSGKTRQKIKASGLTRTTYYRRLNLAYDEFIELGGLRNVMVA